MKISKEQLNQIIKEEVQRAKELQKLNSQKEKLEDAIKKLDEGQDVNLDEFWSGLKAVGKAALGKVGQGVKAAGQSMAADIKATGNQIKTAAQNTYNSAANTYKAAETQSKIAQTKKEIEKMWAEKKQLDTKIRAAQTQYQTLTGQQLGGKFQKKPGAATNPAASQPAQPNAGQNAA